MNYVVATINPWNLRNYKKMQKNKKDKWSLISKKNYLTYEKLKKLNPRYVFIPHWSWIIPKEVWNNFECIVFHMTDLPYGRGGTPLQNLIIRGHKKTKISALKVNAGLDTGDIYIKEPMNLDGTAEEIYTKVSDVVFTKMIPTIIKKKPKPKKQAGRVTTFTRRKPEDSKMPADLSLEKMYDFIRMLDAPSYPKAYIEQGDKKIEFSNAKFKDNQLEITTKIYVKK